MNMLSAKRFEIAESVERVQTELATARAENKKLMAELALLKMEKHISGNNVCVFIDSVSYDELRNCSNSLIEEFEYCYLFSNTDDDNYIYVVSSKENNVREEVQNLNKAFNGKGGGRDTYAQGKITGDKESILEYLK
jgi:alanyl-tRNA synthetase